MVSFQARKLPVILVAAGLVLVAAQAVAKAPPDRKPPAEKPGPLVVHEWGTFLSVQGSDGVTLGGMIDSEEQLPIFVRERALGGRNRACLNQKMETPVTYFYTDRPRTVQVRVDMPKGLLTHWYPRVGAFGPPLSDKKAAPSGSFLDWGTVQLIPTNRPRARGASLPPLRPVNNLIVVTKKGQVLTGAKVRQTAKDLILNAGGLQVVIPLTEIEETANGPQSGWQFPRETDSALVKIGAGDQGRPREEVEKFLFYRGLGSFELPIQVRTAGSGDDVYLTLHNRGQDALRGIFAVRVEKDTIQFAALDDLAAGQIRETATASAFTSRMALKDGVPQAKSAVAAALVKAGLYPKEAQAMVNTWEKSYFRTDGFRLLYVLPRTTVDATIPIRIKPAPEQLVRVMVGRVEVLTPDKERLVEKSVEELGAKSAAARKAASAELARLGRLKEPVLHRIAALTKVPAVRARAEVLIKEAAVAR
ncbi:MAG TPA: hypothetical protein VG013_06375 [Gemmataceae bacterium]|jgi:hypothetical protein|nr:hypothetical protein [Gemmataceae bacterium]